MRLNEREVRVFAMQRSGHHAVIHWLIGHFKGEIFFRNAQDHRKEWNPTLDGIRSLYIFNVEDAFRIRTVVDAIERDAWLNDGISHKVNHMLILRDPYNTLASRLKHEDVHCRQIHVEMWKEYAREYLRETDALPDDTVMVSFNRWYSDEGYRRNISAKFGLEYSERNLRKVTIEGKGSSFQKDETDARNLDLFNRWKYFVGNPRFMNLMKDEEMHELAATIFGDTAREIHKEIFRTPTTVT